MKKFSGLVCVMTLVSSVAGADAALVSAQVFAKGSQQKNLLYTYENKLNQNGDIVISDSAYLDVKKQIVVKEDTQRKGSSLIKYSIDHKQLGKKGSIEVKGSEVIFTYEEKGKTKIDSEELEKNFVVGQTVQPYLASLWSDVMAGKTISVRFGVWDRLETVGFDFKKMGLEKVNGIETIKIQMKPTSFVIAALVDPLYWYFTTDGKEIVQIIGRTIPKLEVKGDLKDLDAETIYSVKEVKM